VKYVLFYDPVPGAGATARRYFDEHKELWSEYVGSGGLLAIGPFCDGSGAMAVFATREAAEEIAGRDPSSCTASSVSGRSGSGTRRCCRRPRKPEPAAPPCG
jgi:uncharacterized protein YciI